MAYKDKSMIPLRHIGRHRRSATGIGAYRDPLAAMTGTFLTTPTEAEVVTGTQTIIITLSNAAWLPAGTAFDGSRQVIIDGLNSNKDEVTGWNTLVRDAMAVTDVVRTSATVVTITMPAAPLYKITADETISFTVPPAAILLGGGNAKGNVTFTVVNAAPTVTCVATGTAVATGVLESEIKAGGETIILTLTGGTWVVAGAAAFDAVRQSIIDGLVSDGAEAHGWNIEVRDKEAVTAVVRTSNTAVTVTLTAAGSYSIAAGETVTATVPKEAIALADADVVAAPTIPITEGS